MPDKRVFRFWPLSWTFGSVPSPKAILSYCFTLFADDFPFTFVSFQRSHFDTLTRIVEFLSIFSSICDDFIFFSSFLYALKPCFTNSQSDATGNLPHYWSKRLEIHSIDTNDELFRKLIDLLANWWCESIEFVASHFAYT